MTEKRAKEFEKLNITDTADLVRYFPRAYLDMTSRVSVREVFHNDMALVACRLTSVAPVRYTGRVNARQPLVRAAPEKYALKRFGARLSPARFAHAKGGARLRGAGVEGGSFPFGHSRRVDR